MTIQKQFSHLSFAAIMLVFAALPALAQTGSVENQTVTATSTLAVSSEVAALRKDRASIPTKESTIVVAPAVTENRPSFSATQFLKSATESTVLGDNPVFEFKSSEKPRESFTNSSSKSINFVPSRGPKLPWQ